MTRTSDGDGIALLRGLRQVRQFTDEPISDDALQDILEVARWTGSAMNRQPWDFVVVRNRTTLRALADAYPNAGHLGGAQLAIILVLSGDRPYDEGRLTERILLAARARGLGAGVAWLANDGAATAAKNLLGIPEDKIVRTAISLGYPAADTGGGSRVNGRKPLAELVHQERFGA